MEIGTVIKRLRRERNLTQEELAERISVTSQAVSKWESGAGLPDISQVVPLANFFGVTTDLLLGVDASRTKQRIQAHIGEIERLMHIWEKDAILDAARRALREFPGNHELMYLLAQNLSQFTPGSGEAIALLGQILDESTDSRMREKTNALMFCACKFSGLPDAAERALAVAKKLPSFVFSREYQLAFDTNDTMRQHRGAGQTADTREFIAELARTLSGVMFINAGGRRLDRYTDGTLDVAASIEQTKRAIEILHAVFGDNLLHMAFAAGEYCSVVAEWYLTIGEREKALDYLELYSKYESEYDAYTDGDRYTSVAVRGVAAEGHTWSDSGAACVRYTLGEDTWDAIRADPRFAALAERLNALPE
ncbi:MAG: helix-turn-helix transcriptional regulator [Oscillospiraceae bacterium]|jgi:transcriptional regulator with XRE-family HTH domain|nr:helix-turn-helix transcriptional regulator [Oscillospiraceae bacterium]